MQRLLVLTLALATIFALAAPAAAKPPNCDEIPWHPACGGANDEPAMAGHECVGYVTDAYTAADGSGHFEFDLGGEYYDACIDVSSVDPEGDWTITYNVTVGTLRELLVLVRDSFSPGDICNYGMRYRQVSKGSITLKPNAADYVNSCGTEFAEWVGNPESGDVEYVDKSIMDLPSPLAFLVFARGTKDLAVHFTVDYPNTH